VYFERFGCAFVFPFCLLWLPLRPRHILFNSVESQPVVAMDSGERFLLIFSEGCPHLASTSRRFCYNRFCPLGGSNSVVECDLAKVEVAGSNPVSRSKKFAILLSLAVGEGFML
jgi:hypothetical protein